MTAHAWWQAPWVRATEAAIGHITAIVVGFILMIVGLGLGVTMIMLPVGVVVGLIGVAMFVSGLFVHINRET